jgi:hypothetical protein
MDRALASARASKLHFHSTGTHGEIRAASIEVVHAREDMHLHQQLEAAIGAHQRLAARLLQPLSRRKSASGSGAAREMARNLAPL